jgi:hypothetical protein
VGVIGLLGTEKWRDGSPTCAGNGYNHSTKKQIYMTDLSRHSYCLECSWMASSEEHTREELNALMVEHTIETGHDVDSGLIHPAIEPPNTPQLN